MHMKMTSTNSSCPTTHVQARCHARDPTTGTGAGRHKKECVGTGTSAVCQVRIAGAKVPESNVLDNINMKIVSLHVGIFFLKFILSGFLLGSRDNLPNDIILVLCKGSCKVMIMSQEIWTHQTAQGSNCGLMAGIKKELGLYLRGASQVIIVCSGGQFKALSTRNLLNLSLVSERQ